MDRDAFEQLISAWLDEPERDDLRRQVAAAIDAAPALAAVLDEWRRFDALFHQGVSDALPVDWRRLHEHISEAIDNEAGSADAFDVSLREITSIEHEVAWDQLRRRISAGVDQAAVVSRPRRLFRWTSMSAVAAAVAAAVFSSVLPSNTPVPTPAGRAMAVVSGPADGTRPVGVASVTVAGPDVASAPAERFFAIEPLRDSAPSADSAGGYY